MKTTHIGDIDGHVTDQIMLELDHGATTIRLPYNSLTSSDIYSYIFLNFGCENFYKMDLKLLENGEVS